MFISLFDIISVVVVLLWPDSKIFYACAADVAAVHSKGIKTLLANG